MGCDTILRLKGHITAEQIIDYIDKNYKFIGSSVKENNYGALNKYNWVKEKYDDSNEWKIISGFITFDDGDKNITISYFYQNINSYENLEYYSERNLENMVKSETTFLSLGCCDNCDNSVEIMKGIAQEFGGWLDENDCDDIPPYWIDKVDKKIIYYWSSDDAYYNGSFDTEQEAIEDAKRTVNNFCEEIYVVTCKEATLSWDNNEDEIIESIYNKLYKECGINEGFEITKEQELELANRIDKCVKQWIKDMKIKPNYWIVVNEHLVKLR